MSNEERKTPVRVQVISGEQFKTDRITDAEFEKAIAMQDAVLYAEGEERKILGRLRHRISMGAPPESERYYFDLDRGIVRTKKAPAQSETRPPAGEREVGS